MRPPSSPARGPCGPTSSRSWPSWKIRTAAPFAGCAAAPGSRPPILSADRPGLRHGSAPAGLVEPRIPEPTHRLPRLGHTAKGEHAWVCDLPRVLAREIHYAGFGCQSRRFRFIENIRFAAAGNALNQAEGRLQITLVASLPGPSPGLPSQAIIGRTDGPFQQSRVPVSRAILPAVLRNRHAGDGARNPRDREYPLGATGNSGHLRPDVQPHRLCLSRSGDPRPSQAETGPTTAGRASPGALVVARGLGRATRQQSNQVGIETRVDLFRPVVPGLGADPVSRSSAKTPAAASQPCRARVPDGRGGPVGLGDSRNLALVRVRQDFLRNEHPTVCHWG